MAIYAIGDVQGCFHKLMELLSVINFDKNKDQLWFSGDLVNRGKNSLEVLRFVRCLGDSAVTVLGNHDFHLIALAYGVNRHKKDDTIEDVLNAPDRDELIGWLKSRPLMHHDPFAGYSLIHAGLPPQWNITKARQCASEVEEVLRSPQCHELLHNLFSNQPTKWSEDLKGWERLRFIVNCFTRLRYCDSSGAVEMECKGPPGAQPSQYVPWFEVPERKSRGEKIIFGHWATLGFHTDTDVFGLDTGCVWGGALTAFRLDCNIRLSVGCSGTISQEEALNLFNKTLKK
jgi:bis(5'-nucleosyl)-tetraphosphatase (symmetrical)